MVLIVLPNLLFVFYIYTLEIIYDLFKYINKLAFFYCRACSTWKGKVNKLSINQSIYIYIYIYIYIKYYDNNTDNADNGFHSTQLKASFLLFYRIR